MNEANLSYIAFSAVNTSSAFDAVLVDVLRPWDCEAQDWADASSFLFRFECEDLLIWKEDGVIRYERGILNTNKSACRLLRKIASVSKNDPCLCWRHDLSFARYIGQSNSMTELIESIR